MDLFDELNELSNDELTEVETILKNNSDIRIHTSKNLIDKLEMRRFTQKPGDKPEGFWYGFGDAWIEWTEFAGPEYKGEYIYEVDINGSNILQIRDYSEIEEFTKEYQFEEQIIPRIIFYIDWPRIASKYDGIEINPYIYNARLNDKFLWYYGWDVASGCIWNLNKVKISQIGLLEDKQYNDIM